MSKSYCASFVHDERTAAFQVENSRLERRFEVQVCGVGDISAKFLWIYGYVNLFSLAGLECAVDMVIQQNLNIRWRWIFIFIDQLIRSEVSLEMDSDLIKVTATLCRWKIVLRVVSV